MDTRSIVKAVLESEDNSTSMEQLFFDHVLSRAPSQLLYEAFLNVVKADVKAAFPAVNRLQFAEQFIISQIRRTLFLREGVLDSDKFSESIITARLLIASNGDEWLCASAYLSDVSDCL